MKFLQVWLASFIGVIVAFLLIAGFFILIIKLLEFSVFTFIAVLVFVLTTALAIDGILKD